MNHRENNKYDYEDVNVFIDEKYVSYEQEVTDPDLSFILGTLHSTLPLIVYYDDPEGISKMEEVCRKYGLITAGAPASQIPLANMSSTEDELVTNDKNVKVEMLGYKLFERFDPLRADSMADIRTLTDDAQALVIGCSLSTRHALALANELQVAAAILVGPTQAATTIRLESIGISVPRITLIESISRAIDVPVISTASSTTDVCKALVAGADAALVHFGGPFAADEDLDFIVKSIADAMRENLLELCCSAGAKSVRSLPDRCRLVTK